MKSGFKFLLVGMALFSLVACNEMPPSPSNIHDVIIDGVHHKVLDGEKAPLLTPEDTEDQIFKEWQVDGEYFDPSTPVTEDIAITSYFRDRLLYQVYFDNEPKPVKEGMTVEKPADPSKEGFVFKGWHDGLIIFDFNTPIYKDHHLESWFDKEIDYHQLSYTELGKIGGNIGREWGLAIHRDEKMMVMQYHSYSKVDGNYGVDLFFQLGTGEFAKRNSRTFLLSFKETGMVSLYNYPNNSRKTIYNLEYFSGFGEIELIPEIADEEETYFLVIPNRTLVQLVGTDYFNDQSNIGISFASVIYPSSSSDLYYNENYLGFNNKPLVDKDDPRDYLRVSYQGQLFDQTHN